jgi:hypothetical protein
LSKMPTFEEVVMSGEERKSERLAKTSSVEIEGERNRDRVLRE